MKIGILSMQRVNNFGSLLQAYALKKMLENEEDQVSFLDIKENEKEKHLLDGYYHPFEREVSERNTLKRKLKEFLFRRIVRKIVKRPWNKQCKLFETFRNEELKIDLTADSYDLVIIGSDEVFNCLTLSSRGYTSQLFGNIPEARNVVSYAASCGSTTFTKIPEEAFDSIKLAVKNLSHISVRDRNTYDFISHFLEKPIEMHFDPVLVYDYGEEIAKAKLPDLPPRACLIYSYHERINEQEEINAINIFCKEHNLIPVTLFGPQIWCKRHIVCTPFECLKAFQNASFVITDTFHGTIFSAKYAFNFAVFIRDSNHNKLQDLTEKMHITEHVIRTSTELNRVYNIRKNQGEIDNIINGERVRTCEYLRECVNDIRDQNL